MLLFGNSGCTLCVACEFTMHACTQVGVERTLLKDMLLKHCESNLRYTARFRSTVDTT